MSPQPTAVQSTADSAKIWLTGVNKEMRLSGWGRYPSVEASVLAPRDAGSTAEIFQNGEGSRMIPRGGGRSYGDSALATRVLSSRYLDDFITLDRRALTIRCGAGTTLAEILRVCVPQGLFLPVVSGTKYTTLGGAIAADIHGKNHHIDGSFCDHIDRFTLLLPSGETAVCSHTENEEYFRATCGGMGLTGMILDATISLKKVPSAFISAQSIPATNLEESLALLRQQNDKQYVVAWVDCLAKDTALGRGVIHLGSHSETGNLEQRAKRKLSVPFTTPGFLLNRYTMSGFNRLYYARQRFKKSVNSVYYDDYFFPLDSIRGWNRLYGAGGFLQYQFVLPDDSAEKGLRETLDTVSRSGKGSFLAVLKRFGPANGNWLSFPSEGVTLTLDFKYEAELLPLLDRLDEIVLAAGGRHYLAKDARMSAAVFRQGYPKWHQFKALKDRIDPAGILGSLQSDRLGLTKAGVRSSQS